MKVIGPAEVREKNIITKRELVALVKVARQRLGLEYDGPNISRDTRRNATAAIAKLERTIAEMR